MGNLFLPLEIRTRQVETAALAEELATPLPQRLPAAGTAALEVSQQCGFLPFLRLRLPTLFHAAFIARMPEKANRRGTTGGGALGYNRGLARWPGTR